MPGGAEEELASARCDECQRKIDESIKDSREADKSLAESMEALKDGLSSRMSSLEAEVAQTMGGVGAILVLNEVAAKLLGAE